MKILLFSLLIILASLGIPVGGVVYQPAVPDSSLHISGTHLINGVSPASDPLLIQPAKGNQMPGTMAGVVSETGIRGGDLISDPTPDSAITEVFSASGDLVHAGSIVNGASGARLLKPWGVYVSGNYAYVTSSGSQALEIVDISNPAIPVHKGSISNGAGGARLNTPWGVYVSGNYAYVADWGGGALEIIDISNPALPVHKGSIVNGTGGARLSGPRGIYVSGKYAYVASSSSSALEIVDISNPALPVHKGYIKDAHDVGGAHLWCPTGVYVSGNYAYVADQDNALEIVDITNPASPVHKGSIIHGTGDALLASPMSVYVSGNYAYVASWVSNALEIVNISNPALPVHKGSMPDGYGGAVLKGPWSVQVSGNYAYLACKDSNALEIVNVSNPTSPEHAGSIVNNTGGALLNGAASVFLSGDQAYLASWNSSALEIVNISTPESPVHTGKIGNGAAGALLDYPYSVHVSGNYAYVTSDESRSLEIVDVSTPASPVHRGSIVNGAGGAALVDPRGVHVSGNYAYVASLGSNALEIVDVSNPASPFHAASIVNGTGSALLKGAAGVYTSGNYAYVASSGSNALEIVDISNPTSPVHAGSIVNNDGGALLNTPWSVYVSGNYAYVASWVSNALEIVNISNPTLPVHAGSIVNGTGGALLGSPRSVSVSGNYAYVASYGSNALEIVNISNATAPVHAGSIRDGVGDALLDHPISVHVSGNYAYVASVASDALEVVDVTNPTAPVHKGRIVNGAYGIALLNAPMSVHVSGNYAYVTSSESDALEIVEIGKWPTITGITPSTAPNTGNQEICITGTNFMAGAVANLTSGSISITGTSVFTNNTTIRRLFTFTGAPTSTYTLKIRNPDSQTAILPNAFTVTNASPTITSITPASGFNSATLPVTIIGSAFRNGVTVSLTCGSTILAGTVTNRTVSQILSTFPLTGVPAGIYNLTVLNTDGTSAKKNNAFTVQQSGPTPTITDFTPAYGINTAALPFTVNGTNFRTGATITITNGTNTKTVSCTPITPVQLKCSLSLSGLPFGLYNLTVLNTDGTSAAQAGAFSVVNPTPAITTISPLSGFYSSTVIITITGTKYVAGCTADLVNGSTTIPGIITSSAATKLVGTFSLQGYPAGLYNITVTNPGGPSVTKVNGFTVAIPGTDPIISSYAPDTGINTAALPIIINGSNFRQGAVVIITNDTTSRTISAATVTPDRVKCSLPLARLPIGLYNLTVRNADGSAVTLPDAFLVTNPAPTISMVIPASGYNTGSVQIAVSGSNFVSGVQVTLVNQTVTIPGAVSTFSSTRLTGTFVLTGCQAGLYNLTVVNPGGQNATKLRCFTVLLPGTEPGITNFNPTSGLSSAALPITINGTNFRPGATVSISNGTITKTGTSTSVTVTKIRCSLPLAGLPIGFYNLTVRNSDGSNITLFDAFSVINPAPTITTINPASGYNTGSIQIAISGSNFVSGALITLVNDSSTIPGTVSTYSGSKLTGTFVLTGCQKGLYNLTVVNPGGPNATKLRCFTVLSPGTEPGITNFNPTSGLSTAALPFMINGTNFRTGAIVTITNRTTTKTGVITSITPTKIGCSLPLTGLPIGLYNLTVQNSDGSNVTRHNAFTVINPEPVVSGITPVSGYNTSITPVMITGAKFLPGASIALISNTTHIPGSIISQSATGISGSFPLTDAPAGRYNLTVSNPGNFNGTKINAFTVLAPGTAPVISTLNPASGFNTGSLPVTITGFNFNKPAVYLNQGMILRLAAATTGKVSTSTILYVTLPLTRVQGGFYNITVRNSDGVNTTAEDIFYVTDQAWIASAPGMAGRKGIMARPDISFVQKPDISNMVYPSGRQIIWGEGVIARKGN